jgi:hypothetical protein
MAGGLVTRLAARGQLHAGARFWHCEGVIEMSPHESELYALMHESTSEPL